MDLSSEPSPSTPDPERPPQTEEARGADKQPPVSEALQALLQSLSQLATPEEKLAAGLVFMRSSISQEGTPRFREFWEARSALLPFFRENLNAIARSKLWADYVELTVEARRLKEILEEQSAFAVEQIELAIQALEVDVKNFDKLVEQMESIDFPQECHALSEKLSTYDEMQKELNLLNALASRLMGLRKEVLKTDMRMRNRTKIFKKLSELGDHIFPKRKDRIEKISASFEADVANFANSHFGPSGVRGAPYYALREEIKALQGLAKTFTLSSKAFGQTRMQLSACWDQLREIEKERRKEFAEKRQASSEQCGAIRAKLEELKPKAADMLLRDLDLELDGLIREMRELNLDRDDVRALRQEFDQLRAPHLEEQEKKAKLAEEAEKEKLRLKREKGDLLKKQLATLIEQAATLELEVLQTTFTDIEKQFSELQPSKLEKQQIERQLRGLRDLLADRKEEALLDLSEDDKKALENLRLVLQQKKERRQEIKLQLETYRKHLGNSGLDFEKAMQMSELVEQEKERLEKANQGIEEIEGKITELEG